MVGAVAGQGGGGEVGKGRKVWDHVVLIRLVKDVHVHYCDHSLKKRML